MQVGSTGYTSTCYLKFRGVGQGIGSNAGLSLIELLLGLSLIFVIMVFSIASFDSVIHKNRLQLRVDEISRIIRYARSRALSEGRSMILVPAASDNWSSGMRLIYQNDSTNADIDHEWQWKPDLVKVEWKGFASDKYLIFSPGVRRNALNGYFTVSSKDQTYKITLNRLARTSITSPGNLTT